MEGREEEGEEEIEQLERKKEEVRKINDEGGTEGKETHVNKAEKKMKTR